MLLGNQALLLPRRRCHPPVGGIGPADLVQGPECQRPNTMTAAFASPDPRRGLIDRPTCPRPDPGVGTDVLLQGLARGAMGPADSSRPTDSSQSTSRDVTTGDATPRDVVGSLNVPTSPWLAYCAESARPIVCLVFIIPILVAYETGILLLGAQAMRNGADVWLRKLLAATGFGQYFLLPILTCGILLAWQHASRQPWRFNARILGGMLLESVALGLLLINVAQWQQSAFDHPQSRASVPAVVARAATDSRCELIAYLGAGIYEELLFRLMLLPCVLGVARCAGLKTVQRTLLAVITTSLVFSAAHYNFVTPGGQPFDVASFSFRFVAGALFCGLFLYRGFGVAVGAHAAYDVCLVCQ